MKIEVDRDDLAAALRGLKPAMGKGDSVRFVAVGDRIAVEARGTGWSRALDITTRIPGAVEEPGSGWLDYKVGTDLVRSLPRLPVRLETGEEAALNVACGAGKFSLTTAVAREEPEDAAREFGAVCVLPAEAFAVIRTVSGYASDDDARPILNNVLVTTEGGKHVKIVGTNGHRLAECNLALPDAVDSFSLMIPRPVAAALALSSKGADAIEVGQAQGGVCRLRWGRTDCVWFSDPQAVYPNYAQVFPPKPMGTWEVDRASLADAAKRMAVFTRRFDSRVGLSFNGVGGIMQRQDPPLVQAEEICGGTYTGLDEFRVDLNASYVHKTMASLAGAETVRLSFVDAVRPVLVEAADPPADAVAQYRMLVMPMRMVS